MRKTLDTMYFYMSGNFQQAQCRIRVYEELDREGHLPGDGASVRTVAVATMSMERPSEGSIVNDAEYLAAEIRDLQLLRLRHRFRHCASPPGVDLTWIQHIGADARNRDPESFDTVTFAPGTGGGYGKPAWSRTDRFAVEMNIGQVLG